jgi:AIR synthase-related protein
MPLDHTSLATDLAARLRATRGIAHKSDLAPILRRLHVPAGTRLGDDCAAIPDGDGFLLVAIEGFLNELVASDPWFAGWCGVMVNASDVAAMGGRPIAVVDAIWSAGLAQAGPILDGLAAAAAAYGIPIVGGHTNTRNDRPQLSVAIVGRARRLITSFDARPGEQLLAAIDLRGRMRSPALWWDASSHHGDTRHLRADLAILPELAEAGLTGAGKDISMGGLIGTALMLAEASGVGLIIDPDLVPRPAGIEPADWLSCFPSYGYLLTASDRNAPEIIARFAANGIACAGVGVIDDSSIVRLRDPDGAHATVWDFTHEPLIGCGA